MLAKLALLLGYMTKKISFSDEKILPNDRSSEKSRGSYDPSDHISKSLKTDAPYTLLHPSPCA
jgi:hypothetical protein